MESLSEKQEKLLELLKDIPHPGKILLLAAKDGSQSFSLRPKSIPLKIIGDNYLSSVELQLLKNGEPFSDQGLPKIWLSLRSDEWKCWAEKHPFIIRQGDAGKELRVIEKRLKSFNGNLLHNFLDQFPLLIRISKEYEEKVLDPDNYPLYFWRDATCVSGTASRSGKEIALETEIYGCSQAVELSSSLRLNYWHFLPEKVKPTIRVLTAWHETLITLLHAIKKNSVDFPLNFPAIREKIASELAAAYSLSRQ